MKIDALLPYLWLPLFLLISSLHSFLLFHYYSFPHPFTPSCFVFVFIAFHFHLIPSFLLASPLFSAPYPFILFHLISVFLDFVLHVIHSHVIHSFPLSTALFLSLFFHNLWLHSLYNFSSFFSDFIPSLPFSLGGGLFCIPFFFTSSRHISFTAQSAGEESLYSLSYLITSGSLNIRLCEA